MKSTTLKKLKDGSQFRLSKRSKVIYQLVRKWKGNATVTSTSSNRSFVKPQATCVFPV